MNAIRELEKDYDSHATMLCRLYYDIGEDEDGRLYREDEYTLVRYYDISITREEFDRICNCHIQMRNELDHRKNMLPVFEELNKVFIKKELKLLSEVYTTLNDDVLDVIGSYISGINGTLLRQIHLL